MSTIRVDRITPYQSGSVTVEGLIVPNLATTGSNTFTGNQNIQGTLTASLQQGYVWVGGSGNVSTLTPTSSFGGALTSGLVSGSSQLTASYDVRYALSGSIGTTITTGSFATTGSNTFKGNQQITGSLSLSSGQFNVTTGSGQLTSSLTFTHNITSPNDGNATLELRHNNDLYNDDIAIKLKADFAGAYIDYEKDGVPYSVLSVQSLANNNIYIHRDTRLLFSSLIIDNNLTITGSLSSSGSANFLGHITGSQSIKANSFTGSFTGSVTVAPSKAIIFSDEHIAISSYGLVPNTSGSYVIKIGQGAGDVNQVSFNTFIGHYAGYSNTTGQSNTYIGNNAGYSSVAGIENTYIGSTTATGAVSGSQNAILGYGTGYYSNGNTNTFIGTRAVTSLGTGSENVVVGAYAATGSSNDEYLKFLSASVIVGFGASPNDDNETNQVIIGHKAIGKGSNTVTIGNDTITNTYLKGTISGSVFTGSFVGDGSGLTGIPGVTPIQTGSFATTGSNTFKGEQIISSSLIVTNAIKGTGSIFLQPDINDVRKLEIYNTAANDVHIKAIGGLTFLGDDTNYVLVDNSSQVISITGVNGVVVSGSLNASGSNTFIGNQVITGSIVVSGSISQKGIGTGNIVIGDDPITNLTENAVYNVIIGQDAGILNSDGASNVFIGKSAGVLNQTGGDNVFIGTYAGYNNKQSYNTFIGGAAGFNNIQGSSNSFFGYYAGYNNKVSDNTFIGYQAGFDNTSGSGNTFVGRGSGENNTTANNNSFFGYNSGRDNSVGQNNTFLGNFTGQTNTSGSYNTFVGSSAGQNHKTAVYNTFVGMNAGLNTGVGNENTFLGYQAGNNNLSGSQNTLLGANANGLSTFSNYVTAVGYGAAYGVTTGSNSVYLGNAAGRYLSDGMTNMTSNTNSVFIGTDSKSNLNAQDNQIVIGYNAVSNGTNTVTIGNNDITDTYVKGVLRASTAILAQVSSSYNFADDTAAQAGGVPLGGLYHTSGSVKIRLV